MSIDVQVFVNKIETVLFAIISQDVLLLVCIANFHDFTSNEVANTSSDIDECEAVCRNPIS